MPKESRFMLALNATKKSIGARPSRIDGIIDALPEAEGDALRSALLDPSIPNDHIHRALLDLCDDPEFVHLDLHPGATVSSIKTWRNKHGVR